MLRLMGHQDLSERIVERMRAGMAVLATCAGVILLAQEVTPKQQSLGMLDVDVERNAYGRQLYSTVAEIALENGFEGGSQMEGVFIRAPRIIRRGSAVEARSSTTS